MTRHWTGTGPAYSVDWAGATWTLHLDAPAPGLYDAVGRGPLLGLDGVAAAGRWEPRALSGSSMTGIEAGRDRVSIAYELPGWGGLRVRATWSLDEVDSIDLEVQAQASTVGELTRLEVLTRSSFQADEADPDARLSVVPRDRFAAESSYDGREPRLGRLTTEPVGDGGPLWLVAKTGRGPGVYAEMTRPGDFSRRIFEGPIPFRGLRQGLFGHDLEKGVVLRARIRAAWFPVDEATELAQRSFEAFAALPPSLGT